MENKFYIYELCNSETLTIPFIFMKDYQSLINIVINIFRIKSTKFLEKVIQ